MLRINIESQFFVYMHKIISRLIVLLRQTLKTWNHRLSTGFVFHSCFQSDSAVVASIKNENICVFKWIQSNTYIISTLFSRCLLSTQNYCRSTNLITRLGKKKEVQCQEWECLRWNVYTTRAEICLRFASYDANPSTDLWQCPIFTAIALVANIWNGPKCSFVQHFHPMIDSFGHSNRNTKDYFFSSFALNDVEKLRFFYETAVIC